MTNVFNCFSLLQYFRNIYFTCLKNSFFKKLKFWIRESLQVRTFEFESPKKGRVFESSSPSPDSVPPLSPIRAFMRKAPALIGARHCATPAPIGAALRHPCATKFDLVAQFFCYCAGLASLSRFPDRIKNGWESRVLTTEIVVYFPNLP